MFYCFLSSAQQFYTYPPLFSQLFQITPKIETTMSVIVFILCALAFIPELFGEKR